MADLAAGDVTYTKTYVNDNNGLKEWHGTVVFGDGALTYPSAGIPSSKAKYGFNRAILDWQVMESNGNGIIYEYDKSAEKIRAIFPTDETGVSADRAGAEFAGASTAPAATTLLVKAVGY